MKSLKMRRRTSVMIAALTLAVSMISSSCSLGSMPSRTSSVSSESESSSSEPSVTDYVHPFDTPVPTETTEVPITDKRILLAEDYMKVLSTGDFDAVSAYFGLSFRDMMEPVFDCYLDIFRVLFANLEYSYGSLFTTNYTDYSLDVTCKVPDIKSCVSIVLEDEEFMNEVSKEWILALVAEFGSDESVTAYAEMVNNILLEALRRIEEGEYTEKVIATGSFRFHDNGVEDWICSGTPEFVKMCAKDDYMWKLIYIDPISEYYLIERVGNLLVSDGTIMQKQLDTCLENKRKEIVEE
jgi:hypothetical protein